MTPHRDNLQGARRGKSFFCAPPSIRILEPHSSPNRIADVPARMLRSDLGRGIFLRRSRSISSTVSPDQPCRRRAARLTADATEARTGRGVTIQTMISALIARIVPLIGRSRNIE